MQGGEGLGEVGNAGSLLRDLVGLKIGEDGLRKLHGAANSFGGEQGENGGGIAALHLALLPFLDGPGGLADIVHGVAKIAEDLRMEAAGADFLLEFAQFGGGLLEPEGRSPEVAGGAGEGDGDAFGLASLSLTDTDDTRARSPAGGEILHFHPAAEDERGGGFQVAAVSIALQGACFRLAGFSSAIFPLERNRDHKGEAVTPATLIRAGLGPGRGRRGRHVFS